MVEIRPECSLWAGYGSDNMQRPRKIKLLRNTSICRKVLDEHVIEFYMSWGVLGACVIFVQWNNNGKPYLLCNHGEEKLSIIFVDKQTEKRFLFMDYVPCFKNGFLLYCDSVNMSIKKHGIPTFLHWNFGVPRAT